MASRNEPVPRRLSDLLEEEQEPFLLENGISERVLKSKATGRNSRGIRRRNRGGGIFRVTLPKLSYWKNIRKALNWETCRLVDCLSELRSKMNATGFLWLSSSSTASEGEVLNGENWWRDGEYSPVSVLEHGNSDDNNLHFSEEKNPPTPCLNSPTESGSVQSSPPPSQKGENKRGLHSPKQHSWESCEYFGQMISGSITVNSREPYKLSANINHLIESDFSYTRRDWSQFQAEMVEIAREIECIIFEDISEESVMDMLGFHCTLET